MKVLAGGCRVYSPEDGDALTEGTRTARAVISPNSGSKRITETVTAYTPGLSPAVANPRAEEVLYVAAGAGACIIAATRYRLRPGAAVFIPPGSVYNIDNDGSETLRIIGSRCPIVPSGADAPVRVRPPGRALSPALVHEDDREEIRAGQDRVFRYLVHTDLGCEQVTQFVGLIPKSKAPFHLHTYEEVIFILEGQGILHLEGQLGASEFGPGTSIYLPDGVVHCIENPGPAPIRLLGVFYPSGSPGAAYEND
jgi:mannose-6-phosphate isomerase-like protein (cupin superfamily)